MVLLLMLAEGFQAAPLPQGLTRLRVRAALMWDSWWATSTSCCHLEPS